MLSSWILRPGFPEDEFPYPPRQASIRVERQLRVTGTEVTLLKSFVSHACLGLEFCSPLLEASLQRPPD